MSYFLHIEGLKELEQQKKWEEVHDLLYDIWASDKLNSGKFIRLFSECWYLLVEWGCIVEASDILYDKYHDTLIKCAGFGLENFMDNSRFLCLAGYMISLFPYMFYRSDDSDDGKFYNEWERRGSDMIRKAQELDPNDKLAKIFRLGGGFGCFNVVRYKKARKSIAAELLVLFPGETEIERYFQEILRES